MAITGKQALIGCALGCGGLFVVVVALIGGFALWISSPGELLEPQTLLGSDTKGYAEWTMHLEDPGTEGFVRELISTMQTLPPEASGDLPPVVFNWIASRHAKETEKDILELFPMVVAWTAQPGVVGDEDLHLLTVSIERFGNRMVFGDWIMGLILGRTKDFQVDRYRNEKIYHLPYQDRGLTFFIRGANLFFTSNVDTAHTAIDRMLSTPAQRKPTGLDGLFAETEQGGPLRGAVTNERGEIARIWGWLEGNAGAPADPQLWDALRGITIAGGPRADGSLAVKLELLAPDAGWAERNTPRLTMALQDALSSTELQPELHARPDGDRIEVDLRIPDLIGSLTGWIHRAGEGIETESGTVRIEL